MTKDENEQSQPLDLMVLLLSSSYLLLNIIARPLCLTQNPPSL